MALSSDSQIDKLQRGRPNRAELPMKIIDRRARRRMTTVRWLCLNRTNGKDSQERLRTSSRTIGEDRQNLTLTLTLTLILTLTLTLNLNLTLSLTYKKKPRKET